MRYDDYESRRLAPVWRRIMILLAVIAAVPVVLWSITVFVRAYVAPPKVPTLRPIATATATATATAETTAGITRASVAAPAEEPRPGLTVAPKAAEPPPIVEARRTATDARAALVEAGGEPPAVPATASPIEPPAAAASPPEPAVAQQAPPPAAEDIPPGVPIAGPVPLPPHRPRVLAMGPSGIPVPRPRPAAAVDSAPTPAIEGDLTQRDYMN
jgi:hypothetical protein